MKTLATVLIVYGLLVFAGGLIGWLKAHSKMSLISGVLFGVGLLVCGAMAYCERCDVLNLARGITLVLLLVMVIRLLRTKKFMPAGMISVISLGVLIYLATFRC